MIFGLQFIAIKVITKWNFAYQYFIVFNSTNWATGQTSLCLFFDDASLRALLSARFSDTVINTILINTVMRQNMFGPDNYVQALKWAWLPWQQVPSYDMALTAWTPWEKENIRQPFVNSFPFCILIVSSKMSWPLFYHLKFETKERR